MDYSRKLKTAESPICINRPSYKPKYNNPLVNYVPIFCSQNVRHLKNHLPFCVIVSLEWSSTSSQSKDSFSKNRVYFILSSLHLLNPY